MIKTGDTHTEYGVATERTYDGDLVGIALGYSLEDAGRIVDSGQALAVVRVDLQVVSAVDIVKDWKED